MKQKLKKSLSLLLAMCMLLGLIPGTVFAEEAENEENAPAWNLTLTAGVGTTGTNLEQDGDKDVAITPVVLTAEEGYTFPEDYGDSTLEAVGLTVLRDSETQVTISGQLTANVTMTLPDAVAVVEEEPEVEEPVDALALAEPRTTISDPYTKDVTIPGGVLDGTIEIEAGVTVTVNGTITIGDGNALIVTGDGTLKRGTKCTGDLFKVEAGKTLTLESDVTIDGANIIAKGSAVNVNNGGKFVMDGGTIQNFRSNNDPGGAAVYVAGNNFSDTTKNGTFIMNDGTIKDNRFESKTIGVGGGAIAVLGTFEMTGGLLTNNYSDTNGGAIGLLGNNPGGQYASVVIKGNAKIVGNTARRWGGGIEAMANRDCGGTPSATLTIAGNALITGNLSNYENSKANDGFGGGVETSDWGGSSTFTVGGNAQITGNNHWASGKYTQDNLYCSPSKTGGWPVLSAAFTGSIGVTPGNGQSAGATFGELNNQTVSEGRFFHDGKNLVNKANTMTWQAPSTGKPITGAAIKLDGGDYKASLTPADAKATYQWYASSTNSVGGGLPIPGANLATFTAGSEYEGMYLYVIADGKEGATGRATSNLLQVKPSPKLTGMTFTPGSLLPAFSQSKTSYELTVLDGTKPITLKTTATGDITVEAGGDTITGANGTYTIPVGKTPVVITAGSKDYTVAIVVPSKPVITGDYTLYYNATDSKLHKNSLTGAVLEATAGNYSGTGSTLTLDGFNFTTSAATALVFPANVVLTVTNENSVVATGKKDGNAEVNCAILAQGALSVNGTGSLATKAAGTGISVQGLLTVEGSAVVNAESTGFLGVTYTGPDCVGISATGGVTIQGSADVTAIAGPSNGNSCGVRTDNTGAITIKGTAILTAAGGQAMKPVKPGATSVGLSAAKFSITDTATVIAHGEHVALQLADASTPGTVFNSAKIAAAVSSNGSGSVTEYTSADYSGFVANQTNFTIGDAVTYKWVQLYLSAKPTTRTEAPAFSPASGQYADKVQVSLFSTTAGATIYYTTDGTVPTASSTKYVAPIAISGLGVTNVKAVAIAGSKTSTVVEATYTLVKGVALSGLTMTATDTANKVSNANLSPSFKTEQREYRVVVPTSTKSVSLTPNASGAPVTMTVGGDKVTNPVAITGDSTVITISVGTAPVTSTYTVTVEKAKTTDVTDKDTYEPLNIVSGFNKDVVVEKPGTPSSFADPYDGVNSGAQFAFFSRGYKADAGNMPADRVIKNPNIKDAEATYKLADYSGPNAVQLSWDNGKAEIRFSTIGTYDKLSIIGSSGNADGHFRTTIHYTDGTTSTATFTAPNWGYAPGVSLQSLSRVKLIGNDKTATGATETGFAMYAFDIPVTQGLLVSHLSVERTDTSTGDTAPRTNIMAISGVVTKGAVKQPTKPADASKDSATGDITLTWANNASAIAYYIDIATDANFADMLPEYSNKRLESTDYTVAAGTVSYTVPGTDILSDPAYYRVRAVSLDGKQSQSSDEGKITGGAGTGAAAELKLNTPVIVGEGKYSFSNAIVTSEAKTIIVGFSNAINPGDGITLPNTSGFTVSSGSNGYSKRITVAAGKTPADIQDYLRQIVFTLGKDGQDVQVTLSSEAISNDTFYYEGTGHYYQFVPFSRTDASKTWNDSYTAAKNMKYAGRTGYLATVTSKDEDMFIKSLSGQIGWLGGTQMFKTTATRVNINGVAHIDPVQGAPAANTDPLNLYYNFTDVDHNNDADRNWVWACGPEVGTAISNNKGESIGNAYVNWNSGEPSGWAHAGKVVSDDQHECCMTTLFQGSKGFSWNDRAIAANVYGSGVTAGYQPYGYFVEYGDKTNGDTLGNADSGSIVTDSQKIEKSKAATDAGSDGAEGLDLTELPEVKKPISSDPNWKLVPGTSPAEYIYVGTNPATGENWEWRYSESDNYILVLKGVNIVTTDRPAIQMPTLPSVDPEKPVYIRVMDGTTNRIENLEDSDPTTDVTVIHSSHSLIIEPSGPQNDGTLDLVGSNMPDSQKGVYGIVSEGSVTIGSFKMTIKLTDNRKTAGAGDASTGIKADGDITLDNPEFDIVIDDTKRTPATPPARGLEPGYRDNVVINGGPIDINIDPKGDKTYPNYKPVIVDGEEKDPDTNGDGKVDENDKLFPIKPPAPEAEKIGQNIIYVYANGSAILVQRDNVLDTTKTSIYYDANRNGEVDNGETYISNDTKNILDADQIVYIFAGAKDKASSGWPLITVIGGKVDYLYAGGRADTANAILNGTPVIDVKGGYVNEIYDGGTNTGVLSAKTVGLVTINVGKNEIKDNDGNVTSTTTGTVNRITSRTDTRTRADSVLVNLSDGVVNTLTPNTENPITLNVEQSAKVKALVNYQALAGKKVNIVGKMNGGASITFEVKPSILTPGTILATATDASFIAGTFHLRDSETGFTAKGKQAIVDGVNVKIAEGGPSKLDKLDLGSVQAPTNDIHPGWTGPDKDGNFVYDKPTDKSEGWELKYEPGENGEGEYILVLKDVNMEVENGPAIQLPKDQPTTIVIEGENKIVVRDTVPDPGKLIGIDAPKGVDIKGDNKSEDILNITVDNSGVELPATPGDVIGINSEKDINITDVTVNINLPGTCSPAKGIEAKEDIKISDGDIKIEIPAAAPATGITTPGNIEIKDTKPSDGKRPTIEIDIEGDKDEESTGLDSGNDIIIGGGDIIIDIATGKPAIGIKADDDVIVDKGEPTPPAKPGDPGNDDGVKPNVDITIGDNLVKPKKTGYPAIGIQAEDKDSKDPTDPAKQPGGILIGGGGDIKIDIPTPPGGYDPANPAPDGKDINKGLDTKGDVIIGEDTGLIIDMVGPGTGVNGDSDGDGKGDVVIEDSDVTIDIKNDPTGSPIGPIIGIEGEDVIIKDTKPGDGEKPNVDITVGEKDEPKSGGTPSIGIKAEDKGNDNKGGDVVIEGGDIKINIPVTGKPSKGIVADDDVIIKPTEPSDPTKDPIRPNVDITIGDPDDPKPTEKGPSTGIEAGDKNNDANPSDPTKPGDGIVIGGGDVIVTIPDAPGNYNPADPENPTDNELKETNNGLDSKGDVIINNGSDIKIEMTGPGTGIKGKDDVIIEDSDVTEKLKNDPTDPDGNGPKEPITGPIKGIESEDGDVVIKDTDPTDDKNEIDIVIGDKKEPNSGGKPGKGIQAGDDVIIAGPDIKIDIPTGKPAIGIEAKDDVVIEPGPKKPADPNKPGDTEKPGEKPKVDIGIGDKNDPATGGSPATGIKADNDPTNNDPGEEDKKGVVVDNGDVNIDITVRPAPTRPVTPPGPGTEPDPTKPSSGIESGGDVDIKDSDVVVDIEDKTKPSDKKGETDGIKADGDVVADNTNLDIIVIGRPGKGIEPNADNDPAGPGKVDIKGDTNLDIKVEPGDPTQKDPTNPDKPNPNPAIDGDLIIDPAPMDPAKPEEKPKPNINVDGKPGVSGDVEAPDGQPAKGPDGNDIVKDSDGNIIVTNTYFFATLDVKVEKVPGTIGTPIQEVNGVTLTLTKDEEGKEAMPFVKGSVKVGDKLTTNCAGVSAVVTAVGTNTLTLKLSGTPTTYRGAPVSVTIPSGKVEGVKVSIKAISDESVWAIAMQDNISRDETLGLDPVPNPGYDPIKPVGPENPEYEPIKYIDENGEKKEAQPDEDITDSGEGWEWYPKPTDPNDPRGDTVDIGGKKYTRPVMILDDVDIKPGDPDAPGIVVPDKTTIVVPEGTDNIIEGGGSPSAKKPAIQVDGVPGKVVITGPGDLILKGDPAVDNSDPATKPAIEVDPDVIINGDGQPMVPVWKDSPAPGHYEIPEGDFDNIIFAHANAVIKKLSKNVTGLTNQPIAEVPGVQVVLQNASLKPNTVTTNTVLTTNTPGISAYVENVSADRTTLTVTLSGTAAAETSDKVMVTVPASYVLEGARLNAFSDQRWAITKPKDPVNPTPPSGGSVTSDEKDKSVEIKKTVSNEDGKKINIFEPDKKQLEQVINDLGKGDEIVIDLNKDRDADDVILKLKGDTLEELAKKEIDIKIIERDIIIEIPAKKLPVDSIINDMGKKPADVDVNIRVYEPTDEEKEKIRKAIETDGSVQTDEPISFEITVSSGSEKRPVDGFDGYVTVSFKITEEQAAKITTAITWQKDGSLLHIPTYVFKESGQHYARVNALVNCTTTLIFNEQHFVDTEGTWYDAVATELASRKIMNGVGNGKFEGGLNITRAEFAVIVVRALGLPVNDTSVFSDLAGDDWYAGAAGAASKYGIVNGADGKFMPMNQITRQEAMAIIARAAKVAEYTGTTGSVSSYPDSSALADWAKEAAAMTVGSGLIKGNDGMIRPTDTITRGETAVLILRLLQKADLVDVRSGT